MSVPNCRARVQTNGRNESEPPTHAGLNQTGMGPSSDLQVSDLPPLGSNEEKRWNNIGDVVKCWAPVPHAPTAPLRESAGYHSFHFYYPDTGQYLE